jgi:spore coat protein U-like protein
MRTTLAALLIVAALPAPALAQRSGGLMQCQLEATSLAFGRYSSSGVAPGDSTATFTVSCITPSAAPVPVQAIVAPVITAPLRQLRTASHALRYQLYVDAARTAPWGDGNGGTATLVASGLVSRNTPFRQRVTVYGRLFGRQAAAVGTYSDQSGASLRY